METKLELFKDNKYFSDKKIILFNGPPRSGKDTICELAMKRFGERAATCRFAGPLKDAVHAMFGLAGIPTEFFNDLKDMPNEYFNGMTPREAYIWFSEEVVKPKFGHDFWAKVAITNIKNVNKPIVIFPDCGFVEEAQELANAFGSENVAIVHLYREGKAFKTDKVKDSRSYVTNVQCAKYTVHNDGILSDLYDEISGIISTFAP